jgi:hypothetical protein
MGIGLFLGMMPPFNESLDMFHDALYDWTVLSFTLLRGFDALPWERFKHEQFVRFDNSTNVGSTKQDGLVSDEN